MNYIDNIEDTLKLLLKQLGNYWEDIDSEVIKAALPAALKDVSEGFSGTMNRRFFDGKTAMLSPYISTQWMIFLYRLSHHIYLAASTDTPKEADQVYYLNKIMHANDWFYAVNLPVHFMCEHPLGSVLGRAEYGDYFFVYQGTTVGGNRSGGVLSYPHIGKNVILYANATVLGNTHIGNNVAVSADTYLINEIIPDNCIVFGRSPNIIIKTKTEQEIKKLTKHIWGWED